MASPQIANTPIPVSAKMLSTITQSCQRGSRTAAPYHRLAAVADEWRAFAARPSQEKMRPMQLRFTRWGIALMALAVATLAAPGAIAKRARPKPYVFELFKVELKPGIPDKVKTQVEKQAIASIDEHAELSSKLGRSVPDPDKDPRGYEKAVNSQGQRAFKVNIEVTSYKSEVEQTSADSPRRLVVSISLRMFGETIPQRVMAFTGDGAATVKVDIGKTLRPRDSEYANDEAIKLAVADAITTSIKKLKEAAKKKKNRKKS